MNTGNTIGSDDRGKHTNRPAKISDAMKNSIRSHIESFPVMEFHFCRKRSQKKYLEEGLNISLMYILYKTDMMKKGLFAEQELVSEQSYRKIFCDEYNYIFYVSKKDR